MGMLDPSQHGGLRVQGEMMGPSAVQFMIEEYLVQEGEAVKQGQLIARLKSPNLMTEIESKQEQVGMKKEQFEELTGMSYEQLRSSTFSRGITIYAPISGRITQLEVEEGTKLELGNTIARIVDDSRYIVEIMLFEAEYPKVREGQKVLLRFPYYDSFLDATISRINHNRMPYKSPNADEDSFPSGFAHRVTIEGENKGLIQPGMDVSVGIEENNGIRYFSNYGRVVKYGQEERVINTLEAIVTNVHVDNMALVEKGDPVLTMAGTDIQKMIQEKIDEIMNMETELRQLLLPADSNL